MEIETNEATLYRQIFQKHIFNLDEKKPNKKKTVNKWKHPKGRMKTWHKAYGRLAAMISIPHDLMEWCCSLNIIITVAPRPDQSNLRNVTGLRLRGNKTRNVCKSYPFFFFFFFFCRPRITWVRGWCSVTFVGLPVQRLELASSLWSSDKGDLVCKSLQWQHVYCIVRIRSQSLIIS